MKKFLPLFLVFLLSVSSFAQEAPFKYESLEHDEEVLNSLVEITAYNLDDLGLPCGFKCGSGVVIAKSDKPHPQFPDYVQGLVLTAHHVVEGASNIDLKFRTSEMPSRAAKMVGMNFHHDVAVVVGFVHKDAVALDISTIVPGKGAKVKAGGYGGGKLRYHEAPVIGLKDQKVRLGHIVQRGMSGGFIVDENNKIVGIVSAGTWPEQFNDENKAYFGNCLICTLLSIRQLVYDQGIMKDFNESTR